MNIPAFVDSLSIMGRGLLAIFVVMIVIWLMIALIKTCFHSSK